MEHEVNFPIDFTVDERLLLDKIFSLIILKKSIHIYKIDITKHDIFTETESKIFNSLKRKIDINYNVPTDDELDEIINKLLKTLNDDDTN